MTLSETEINSIVKALEVASEQYEKDAATIAKEFGEGGRSHRASKLQAAEARRLAEKIDGYRIQLLP